LTPLEPPSAVAATSSMLMFTAPASTMANTTS